MDGLTAIRSGDEPYMQFDKLKLRNYFPHEIEKLSVLRITQTRSFDEVGHPIRGGLYDPALGPTEPRDRCETCNQYEVQCPGHVGHIRLDVPVFNPILYSFCFNLLKGSCVQCHRFTCGTDGVATKVLLAQLRCFELGVPHLAPEIETQLKDKFGASQQSVFMTEEEELQMFAELDKLISDRAGRPLCSLSADTPCKNTVDLRKTVIKDYLRDHLFKRKARCPLCKGFNGQIRNDGARCVLIDFTVHGKKRKKTDVYKSGFEGDDLEEDVDFADDEKENKSTMLNDVGYGGVEVTEGALELQMRSVQSGACEKLAWRGAEVREHFRILFKSEGKLLLKLFPMLIDEGAGGLCPLDGLFCELIMVPPTKFRPIRMFRGERYENPQSVNLRRVLEATETIKAVALVLNGDKSAQLMELISNRTQGKTMNAKMHSAYLQLQQRVNAIYDEELDKQNQNRIPGIKQILEKKEGLFRMNMMGKRVNFACRSVITPDPYLDIDEIGIPEIFAKKLTFTEPVNLLNKEHLRKLVLNGPTVYPGANFVVHSTGKKQLLQEDSAARDSRMRRLAAMRQLEPANTDKLRPPMKVLRHLRNGDMMMMNRQPSLHKPSIQGHRARVITGQRALRMNYAPCKAYNADFDGDEMNGHLVQSHIAQCEVAELANVGSNFLVPKDATPLLGLIQDHVVSGVLLTIRGRFLTKEDFMHLVFSAFAHHTKRIEIPPPAMIKPRQLWSGKQVISCIVKNCIPKGKPLINLTSKAKTPLSCWKVHGFDTPKHNMSESEVVFRQGELLVGVLDKQHYGATQYGLVHSCFELYGHKVGVQILSCFSRLFTTHLQIHGFTLGVADILVRKDADKVRKQAIKESRTIGDQVVRSAFGLDENVSHEEIHRILASTYCNPRGQGQDVKMLDYSMKQAIAKYNDAITKACVPDGLIRQFPENALQVMIQSGAKGSAVNAIQISCCLGQIELEGKRMAVTVAGRTLPSFRAFDPSPRAGGYIDQRFLTGINPQELFFHTMAGREGLIDTAVKTSRSGYLQRCLIKHLEGLKIHYDGTVRDHDGSVVQFRYGEDGLDVSKSTYINPKTFPFLKDNLDAVIRCSKPEEARDYDYNVEAAEKQYRKIEKWRKKTASDGGHRAKKVYISGFTEFSIDQIGVNKERIVGMWAEMDQGEREVYEKRAPRKCPHAVDEEFNVNSTLGALPEKTLDSISKFCGKNDKLRRSLFWKGMRSLAEPGENVGLLAAQSIGEPSTQMTLNTFHFAGRGEMNVTLGIPRLREILMTASDHIATPSAKIPILPGTPRERIDAIRRELDRVFLKQVLRNFSFEERINLTSSDCWRRYYLRIEILSSAKREQNAKHLKRKMILQELERRFLRSLATSISKKYRDILEYQQVQHRKLRAGNLSAGIGQRDTPGGVPRRTHHMDDGNSSDEEAAGGREADAAEQRLHNRHLDDAAEYEGEEEDRGEVENDDEEKQNEIQEENEDSEREQDDEDEDSEENREATIEERKKSADERIRFVISQSNLIVDYKFDVNSERWCEVVFQLPLGNKSKLDLSTIVEKEVEKFIVHQTPGIERCIETEEVVNDMPTKFLQTQGINLEAFFRHSDVLDVNAIYSNDLNLILHQYGVEACSRAIVQEMNNVFAVYGIEVSKRHLSLTADYMTFTGKIAPFNRGAMSSSSSPLQKMTFETTMAFMKESLLHGEEDTLSSPSARLVMGSLARGGTGAFDLLISPEYST
ncbi:DNA-directed RNA polymerase subunit [Trichostrongylus colubriformis]|uniref:DNA-directed RNA polymerase subunit n=1 Tax=Trichostrongylus colubriformis TaxID=6319 RepID=A0AAN8F8S0_TRICO